MGLSFAWDDNKNKANYKKHGIWFEEAQSVFDDGKGRVFLDTDHSIDEDRFILIGKTSEKLLLVVVHTFRDTDSIARIISARRASKTERAFYEEGI